jgi:hypothetical protein
MESDYPETDAKEPTATATEPAPPKGDEPSSSPPDPAALVDRLIEAGEWPEPDLLDQIAAAGEAALGPLLAFMRTYPSDKDAQRESTLYHGIGILNRIRSPDAIPVLVEIIKRYPEDSGELAAETLGGFGEIGFGPALELIQDPQMAGYPRQHAINAARRAAGSDPGRRARLAEVLRPLLADAMERSRAALRREYPGPDKAKDEDDEYDGEDVEFEDEGEPEEDLEGSSEAPAISTAVQSPYSAGTSRLEPYEEVAFLVSDLADIADPEARDLIKTAFAEDLLETWIIDQQSVEESYSEGGEETRPPTDWLVLYRERFREHIERLNRPATAPRPFIPTLRESREEPGERPAIQPLETIRKTGPKIGRNDPCWCGSGKKYKKCHLGKDGWT